MTSSHHSDRACRRKLRLLPRRCPTCAAPPWTEAAQPLLISQSGSPSTGGAISIASCSPIGAAPDLISSPVKVYPFSRTPMIFRASCWVLGQSPRNVNLLGGAPVINKLKISYAWSWRWQFFDALRHVGTAVRCSVFPSARRREPTGSRGLVPESIDWKIRVAAKLNSKPWPRPNKSWAQTQTIEQQQLQRVDRVAHRVACEFAGEKQPAVRYGIIQGVYNCALRVPANPLKLLI